MVLYDEYAEVCREYKGTYGERTLVLFEVGTFMEFYDCDKGLGADVQRVCDLLNVLSTRKTRGDPVTRANPMFGGVPTKALPKYLPLLLDADYTVVIVSQVTPPPHVTRRVTEVVSRTTGGANDSLLSAAARPVHGEDANNLMAVFVADDGSSAVGWAVVDLTTGRSTAASGTADELHHAVSVAQPREVVVVGPKKGVGETEEGREDDEDEELFAQAGIKGINKGGVCDWRGPRYADLLRVAYQREVLLKVFPNHGHLTPAEYVDMDRRPHALTAFVAALEFVYRHNEALLSEIQRPVVAAAPAIMCYNALQQLDVIGGGSSLLSVLNCCKTAVGRRAFRARLLDPVADVEELRRRYDAVDVALKDRRFERARRCLEGVYDVERMHRRVCLGRLHPSEAGTMVASLRKAGDAMACLHLDATPLEELAARIACVLDLEAASKCTMDDFCCNVFARGQHPDLDEMQDELGRCTSAFHEAAAYLNGLARADNHIRIESSDADGMWLVVTAKRWRALEAASSCTPPPSFRGAPFSFSPATTRLSHPHLILENASLKAVRHMLAHATRERYVAFLRGLAVTEEARFRAAVAGIEAADVTSACARNAVEMRHVRPSLSTTTSENGSRIKAGALRHPVIEHLMRERNVKVRYVPNDVALGGADGGMLLYGVNAVGKSSVMKAVGLCALMAQAGMFVACTSCELAPFRRIFTRAGLRDDMARGHSTFMVEMLELRGIMRQADAHSLVLGDELCAGTEAASALAIVGAGVGALCERRVAFLLATHLHELVDLPQVRDLLPGLRVFHLSVHCERPSGRLVMDRTLAPGRGMPTYGLEVCKSLDMDLDFLRIAEDIRRHVLKKPGQLVRPRRSHYNASIYVDLCGVCEEPANQTHHILFQAGADKDGFFEGGGGARKNDASNLVPLCEACHDKVHHSHELVIEGYEQTSDGVRLRWHSASGEAAR